MNPERIKPLVAIALALLSLAITAAGVSQVRWLFPLGAMLTLVLPGYGLTAALLPRMAGLERLFAVVGVSIVVDILGGLLLNLTPWGMVPLTWAIWLSGISVASSSLAFVANRREARDQGPKSPIPGWVFGLSFAVASMVLVFALGSGVLSTYEGQYPFTQFWAVPVRDKEPYALQIGVRNYEGEPTVYRIMLESGGRTLREWESVRLDPEGEWKTQLDLGSMPAEELRVRLYRQGTIWEYRSVRIVPSSLRTQ